jgi:hypothetical protein
VTALRARPLTATRAPLGSTAARHYDQAAETAVAAVRLWPGITWGQGDGCLCSWAFRGGAMQVKVRSGACVVHIPGRRPAPAPGESGPTTAELLGELIALVAETVEADRRRWCGSYKGYRRHIRDESEVCPPCRAAAREYEGRREAA